ncbi:MAG TPA: peptidyl-prolyl cis-trans isomerase [Vicinamibacterales bacterium]|nr:peptidyl-prolyl cis-trans isomerase [Vicinamibacterales bacterium]
MTLLDRMRRHRHWLKWSLALVVLAFILLYIPNFLDTGATGGPAATDAVAEVEGDDITVAEVRRAYTQQLQAFRNTYGGQLDERTLRQLGLEQRILQQLIDERVALAEAARLGLRVSDAELRARILSMPAFQENGRFIGDERYRRLLRMQRPPMRPDEFEAQLRRSLLIEKLRAALTSWITVSDEEVDAEFRRRNEKVKLEFVALGAAAFRAGLEPSDDEIRRYFDAHREEFRIPEKRRVKYVLIDMQALRPKVPVSEADLRRAYEENLDQYSTPEQVRASHILLKIGEGTPGGDEAVRRQAEALVAKIRAGADFAELARRYSQDEATAKNGGDLGFFGRGAMVREFEEAAFSMAPGQVSDPVKTAYGYHIIKVVEKREASTRPFSEVRAQIEDQLRWERAQRQAERLADELAGQIDDAADLERVARARGLTVSESGFFERDEPIAGIGFAPEAAARAFALEPGRASEPIRTAQGYVLLVVTGRQDSRVPKLEEVRAKVREALVTQQALERAKRRAAELLPALRSRPFAEAAKAAGLEVRTTDLIARGSPLPDVGVSEAVDDAVFRLPAGAVSDPIVTGEHVVIARVVERRDVTAAELASGRAALAQQMVAERRERFFAAYMARARQRMDIRIARDRLRELFA